MGNLFGSLLASTSALRVIERGISTVQSNVVNANTPGYAKQRLILEARRFEPDLNVIGGVNSGGLYNYRDAFSESTVQRRTSQAAVEEQLKSSLSSLEPLFPVTEGAGVPAAINKFFSAFSQLTVSPNDSASRQVALDRASDVAFSFRSTSRRLFEERGGAQVSVQTSVSLINDIAGRIRDLNANRSGNSQAGSDPGSDAKLYAALEELAEYVDFTVTPASSGGVSVYLGGQSLLVIGDRKYEISSDVVGDKARILDAEGTEITGDLNGGKLVGLVDVYNNRIPGYLEDLDTLATSFADTINSTLSEGVDQNGNAPQQSLFSYDPTYGSAFTITTNSLTPEDLAVATPGQTGGNSNAIRIAGLDKEPVVNNKTFNQFYGVLAGRVGREVAGAKSSAGIQTDLLTQSKELRSDAQEVSLDEEAGQLIQYQRAYQATAQLFKIINEMTDTLINALR